MLPKAKYLKKVRERLAIVQQLLHNPDQLRVIFKRMKHLIDSNDINNHADKVIKLIHQDVPALLAAIQEAKKKPNPEQVKSNEQEPNPGDTTHEDAS